MAKLLSFFAGGFLGWISGCQCKFLEEITFGDTLRMSQWLLEQLDGDLSKFNIRGRNSKEQTLPFVTNVVSNTRQDTAQKTRPLSYCAAKRTL